MNLFFFISMTCLETTKTAECFFLEVRRLAGSLHLPPPVSDADTRVGISSQPNEETKTEAERRSVKGGKKVETTGSSSALRPGEGPGEGD